MVLGLLAETTLLSLTEETQRFERDHHKPHGRIQDSPLGPSLQPVREQRPPRTFPGPLSPRYEALVHQFVQMLSQGVV